MPPERSLKRKLAVPICEEFCVESLACHETASPWSYFRDEEPDSSSCHITKSSNLSQNPNWNVDNEIISVMPPERSLKRKLTVPICEEFCMESLACHETVSPWSYFRDEEPDSSNCHRTKKSFSSSQNTNWNVHNQIIGDTHSYSSIFGQASYQISRRGAMVEYEDSGDDSNTCIHCNASFWAEEALKRKIKNQYVYTNCCEKDGITRCCDVGKTIILPGTHTGSPRDMLNNYQDAMAICRYYGNPDLFITFTCNVKWPEIVRYFKKKTGYKAEDRPDIICRIFKIKEDNMIEFIKSGKPFGPVHAHVCTIEFQKRGLPHAHLLFWLQKEYKCYTSTDIDSIICAELPDKNINPQLFEIVSQFMIHGPYGQLNPQSPCMRDGKCTKSFPKPYNFDTIFHAIKAPLYRRRDDDSKYCVKNGIHIGNNFVVPYSPILLLRYNAHINVESCSQSMLIKYLFKYVNKGPDRARVLVQDSVNDEIQSYLNCRYLTPHESVWRLFEFSIHSKYPAVQYLKIHLSNEHIVFFNEGQTLEQVVENSNNEQTMLNAWFHANNIYKDAVNLTYAQFPTAFVWDNDSKAWYQRKKRYDVIGRIAHVPPTAGSMSSFRIIR